jgi:predicted transcriptional regulator
MSNTTLELTLDVRLKKRLERLALLTRRHSRSLALDAIRQYVGANEWHVQEIRKAIREADQKEFANKREVHRVFSKWMKKQN